MSPGTEEARAIAGTERTEPGKLQRSVTGRKGYSGSRAG